MQATCTSDEDTNRASIARIPKEAAYRQFRQTRQSGGQNPDTRIPKTEASSESSGSSPEVHDVGEAEASGRDTDHPAPSAGRGSEARDIDFGVDPEKADQGVAPWEPGWRLFPLCPGVIQTFKQHCQPCT